MDFHKTIEDFLAAIQYTAATTGFRSELIEKDYFCSMILSSLYNKNSCPLIFKGGTMLAKVYGNFYRLSEDLDFSYDIPMKTTRNERREMSLTVKEIYHQIVDQVDGINITMDLKSSDQSRQYNGELGYESYVTKSAGYIKFEVSLRDSLLDLASGKAAKTLILNPFTSEELVSPFPVLCYSKKEAYAEKIRAAFCRQQTAIRDFYDIAYALDKNIINLQDDDFLDTVRSKIKSQEKNYRPLTTQKIQLLHNQMLPELFPTLRYSDYNNFDLDKILQTLHEFSERI
ncbi:MAG: nucleotidyl transferase AbiEii/AbiGii toxin family protein [Candidatus Berkiellales bacterium]